MKKEKEINEIEVGEDVSRNGEFIPTKFAWISFGYQKENAKRLQNITKNTKLILKRHYFFIKICYNTLLYSIMMQMYK